MPILILFILYTIPFIALIYYTLNFSSKFYTFFKTLNSIDFILIGLFCSYQNPKENLLIYLIPAFILCLTGDILLSFYHRNKKNRYIISGIISFLLGHIVFSYAFLHIVNLDIYIFIIPTVILVLTYFLTNLKGMKAGKLKPAIWFYSFFVALLFSIGLFMLIRHQNIHSIYVFIGSLLFLISDSILLFLYFYKNLKVLHVLNLIAYYYGMFFLACSLLF